MKIHFFHFIRVKNRLYLMSSLQNSITYKGKRVVFKNMALYVFSEIREMKSRVRYERIKLKEPVHLGEITVI